MDIACLPFESIGQLRHCWLRQAGHGLPIRTEACDGCIMHEMEIALDPASYHPDDCYLGTFRLLGAYTEKRMRVGVHAAFTSDVLTSKSHCRCARTISHP